MRMRRIAFLTLVLMVAALPVTGWLNAEDYGEPAYEVDEASLVDYGDLATEEPKSGKTMAEFVDELTYGKDRIFTDEDTLLLMEAARMIKDTDREMARKIERIATKISNL